MDSSGEMNMLDNPMTQFETDSVPLKLRTDPDEISQNDNKSLNKTVATSQPANFQILAAEIEPGKDSDKFPTPLEDDLKRKLLMLPM